MKPQRLFFAMQCLTKPRRLRHACLFAGVNADLVEEIAQAVQGESGRVVPFLDERYAIGPPDDMVRPVIVKHGPGAYVAGAVHLDEHGLTDAAMLPRLKALAAQHGGQWRTVSLPCMRAKVT